MFLSLSLFKAGDTPLHKALRRKHVLVAKALLELGLADTGIENKVRINLHHEDLMSLFSYYRYFIRIEIVLHKSS